MKRTVLMLACADSPRAPGAAALDGGSWWQLAAAGGSCHAAHLPSLLHAMPEPWPSCSKPTSRLSLPAPAPPMWPLQVGLASMTMAAQRAGGSTSHTAAALDQRLEELAAGIEAGAGSEALSMGFECLQEDAGEVRQLLVWCHGCCYRSTTAQLHRGAGYTWVLHALAQAAG